MNKYIRVCDDCGTPLIFTFAFDYCERYCLNCGTMGGMLETGKDVPADLRTIFKKLLVDSIWGIIYKKEWLLPNGKFGKSGCKKDDKENRFASSCDDHRGHLTKKEIQKDEIAREYLEKVKGLLSPTEKAR